MKYWIHSYSTNNTTLLFVHQNRGAEAMNEINIIPRYGGIIVHDCWSSYLSYENVEHGLCGGHILRELKFIEESTKNTWATKMKILLQEAAEKVAKRPAKRTLTEKENKQLQKEYRKIIKEAKLELPLFPRPTGKMGRPKHTDAQNLWLRLELYESSVLLFAKKKSVDFTNNRAERDLRITKLKQKVSGTFRKIEFAEHFCRIVGYVKSMRYRGYSSLEAITFALRGEIPV
jgi:transposase